MQREFIRVPLTICCIIIIIFQFHISTSLDLSSDGGYHISIGIDHNVAEPSNLESFLQNIKATIQTFSNSLYIATWEVFFIKTVQIYIPNNWASGNYQKSVKGLQNTDIQILKTIASARVENPNVCGLPGKFIQLPKNFFDLYSENPFEKNYKVLLTLWARFRYGIWEEHGYPGDDESRFPYFYKELDEQSWQTTGCSDVPIIGSYVNLFEPDSDTCNITQVEPLPESCRFIPDYIGNKAQSSLMYLHSMDEITRFCDETNHDFNSPNKQNLFCNYKSIREIMNQTMDFKKVTNPANEVPLTTFEVFREEVGPVLYVLLDKGKIESPDLDLNLKWGIQTLVSKLSNTTYLSIGTFGIERGPLDLYVQRSLDWFPVSNVTPQINSLIWENPHDSVEFRDVGQAILDAIDTIAELSPLNGAVLLVVKTGVENGSFGKIAYEEEVLLQLRMQNIKLFTMELNDSVTSQHLKYFTEQVDGSYYEINTLNIANVSMFESIAVDIMNEMEQGIVIPYPEIYPVFISSSVPNAWVEFYVKPNTSKVIASLTVKYDTDVYFLGETQEVRAEWNEVNDEQRRKIIFTELDCDGAFESFSNEGFHCKLQYTCPAGSSCEESNFHFLVIYGISSTIETDSTDLNIQIFTSSENNILDLSDEGYSYNDFPFALFIQVKNHEGILITNLTVQALVINYKTRLIETLSLTDNGQGPDITQNDGIYSCAFIPSSQSDGIFRVVGIIKNINHHHEHVTSGLQHQVQLQDNKKNFLPVPIDQSQQLIFSNCSSSSKDSICRVATNTSLNFYYQLSPMMRGTLIVKNRNMFQLIGKPTRILDVQSKLDGTLITLNFPAPYQLGKMSHFDNLTYCIYVNTSKETLIHTPIRDLNSTKETEISFSDPGKPTTLIFDLDGIVEPKGSGNSNSNGLTPVYVRINSHVTGKPNLRSELSKLITVEVAIQLPTTTFVSTTNTDETETKTTTLAYTSMSENTEFTSYSTENITSSTETLEDKADEDKPFFKTGAGITVIVLIVVSFLIAIASGVWVYHKRFRDRGSSRA